MVDTDKIFLIAGGAATVAISLVFIGATGNLNKPSITVGTPPPHSRANIGERPLCPKDCPMLRRVTLKYVDGKIGEKKVCIANPCILLNQKTDTFPVKVGEAPEKL